MNGYKIMCILEYIRKQGRLPRDPAGVILDPCALLVWYGLDKRLTDREQAYLVGELAAMVEAELFVELLGLEER